MRWSVSAILLMKIKPPHKTSLTVSLLGLIFSLMIVEQYPELQLLSPERKLALAAELFEDATDCAATKPDPEIIKLLDQRCAEYERDPLAGSPWSEVRARILSRRES